jgi:hypothetical protein
MEIIFIVVFAATMFYLGLWKFVAAVFSVILIAYLISEAFAKKRVVEGERCEKL